MQELLRDSDVRGALTEVEVQLLSALSGRFRAATNALGDTNITHDAEAYVHGLEVRVCMGVLCVGVAEALRVGGPWMHGHTVCAAWCYLRPCTRNFPGVRTRLRCWPRR